MADPALRFGDNAPGAFFVDASCIDCARCLSAAPETFAASPEGGHARVHAQPADASALARARAALASCPVDAIGEDGARVLPAPKRLLEGLYGLAAFAPEDGALGYVLRRPEGNMAIDPPPLTPELARALEALGDTRFVAFTHLDHAEAAEEAEAYRAHFGAALWAPEPDAARWGLAETGAPEDWGPELASRPAPGHTPGAVAIRWARHGGVLFTGDTLIAEAGGRLVTPNYAHTWDFAAQRASVSTLLADPGWRHVAPGRAEGPLPGGYVPNARRRLAL